MNKISLYALVFLGMFLESLNGFLSKISVSDIGIVLTFVLWSFFGFVFSLLITCFQGKSNELISSLKNNAFVFSKIVVCVIAGWLCWFFAFKFEAVFVVFFVINLYVVFSLLLSFFILKEVFHLLEWLGIVFAVIGTVILLYKPFGHSIGIIFCVLNAAFYALQYFFVKQLMQKKDVDPMTLSTIRTFGLLCFSVILLLFYGPDFLNNLRFSSVVIGMLGGACGVVLAKYLIYYALKLMEYGRLSVLRVWQPVLTLLMSALLFSEVLVVQSIFGISIIFLGTTLIMFGDSRKQDISR